MITVSFFDFQTFLWYDKRTPRMTKEALYEVYKHIHKEDKGFYNLLEIVENWNFVEILRENIQSDFDEYVENIRQQGGWYCTTSRSVIYQDNDKIWTKPQEFKNNTQRRAESRKHLQEEYAAAHPQG